MIPDPARSSPAGNASPTGNAGETIAGDYDRLRNRVGTVPIGRDAVAVRGPDATAYLQGQCSQDVERLAEGASVDALLLSPQGKIDALVRVTRRAPDDLLVDVDEGHGAAVIDRLLRFRLRVKVDVEPETWHVTAVRGPESSRVTERAPGWCVPFVWGAVAGVDVFTTEPWTAHDVPACDVAAWEALRIEAGIPVMGREIDSQTIAAEAGLVRRTVDFDKGCFTGQELVARLDARGSRVARVLRGLVVDTGAEQPAAGTSVLVSARTVGAVTSAAWSPGLQATVALAYVHRSVEPPAAVELADPADSRRRWTGEARVLPILPA